LRVVELGALRGGSRLGPEPDGGPLAAPAVQLLRGPSRWSREPAIRIADVPAPIDATPAQAGLVQALVTLLPGLPAHPCGREPTGGFTAALLAGTSLAHVASHVALELQLLAGVDVRVAEGCGTDRRQPGEMVFAYRDEHVGRETARGAIDLLGQLLEGGEAGTRRQLELVVARLARLVTASALPRHTAEIVDAASARDIPSIVLDRRRHPLVQLGHGVHQRRIRTTTTSMTSFTAANVALDKSLANELLGAAGLPVPRSLAVTGAPSAVDAARSIGYPVVVKPRFGKHGLGVTTGLRSAREVRRAYAKAHKESGDENVVVEEHVGGRDFRVLVIGGRVVAVSERLPAHVVGDGEHTVEELVGIVNADPHRGSHKERPLTFIELGHDAEASLARQGLTRMSVPEAGRPVRLAMTANLSTGGTAVDRTEDIHPDNMLIAASAVETVGLDVAGVDLIAEDVSVPMHGGRGVVVEVNQSPGLRPHLYPSGGAPRDVIGAYLDLLFPGGSNGRVPVVGVASNPVAAQVADLVAHILATAGRMPGTATRFGFGFGGGTLATRDMTGWAAAGAVLRHPRIDTAVLEVAASGVLEEGLGYDRNDVAVILPPEAVDEVAASEPFAQLARVMVEAVPASGTAVLHAYDPHAPTLATACAGSVLLIATSQALLAEALSVDDHCRRGGSALVTEPSEAGERLVLREAGARRLGPGVREVPALRAAPARAAVATLLAAAGAAWAAGVGMDDIERGLRTIDDTLGAPRS
jgi:cyanophycin synthetase